ncbi:MAG: RAMP superfamily CRISPR-associated protein [Ferruginibacter sp.]
MPTAIYSIEAITNLHVGSGDVNYDIVDKEIQRDAATELPTIHASSLKGALREFLTDKAWMDVDTAFGCAEDTNANKKQQSGAFSFLAADIVALPAATTSSPFYTRVHCDSLLADLQLRKYSHLQFSMPAGNSFEGSIADSAKFRDVAADLPVIARNQLDNGISQNLWYERIVPHKAVFLTGIIYETSDTEMFTAFNNLITSELVQVGANATVGYGLCRFKKIN